MSTTTLQIEKKMISVPKLRFPGFDKEWESKKLGDAGKIRMCKRIFSTETSESGEIPFYKIGTFGKEADAYITEELYLDYKSRFSFPKIGQILMSASGTLGRTVVYDGRPAYFQDSNIVWIDNSEEVITNSFLFYIYQIVRYDSEGGTIQRLYNSIISNTKFNRPTLPEQQKIASFLSAVDEKIQQLSRKKELLEQYKKGVMQQLFSGKLRFKDENGKDYPDWEKGRFSKYIRLYRGSSPRPIIKYVTTSEDGVNWIKIGDTKVAENYRISSVSEKITKKGSLKSRFVERGEIILANSMSFGKSYLLQIEGCIYDGWFVLREYEKSFDKEFLLQVLNSEFLQRQYFRLSTGGVVQNISSDIVYSTLLFCPSLPEQQKIAIFLSGIDVKIEQANRELVKTQEFKKGLLQQMFV